MIVELTKDELGIINNALNEVCNGIDLEGEFDTRMGCTVAEARELLAKIHAIAAVKCPRLLYQSLCEFSFDSWVQRG
jgi:hypothetical protein